MIKISDKNLILMFTIFEKIAVFLPLFYPYFNGFNRQNFNPSSTIPLLRNLTSIRLTVL